MKFPQTKKDFQEAEWCDEFLQDDSGQYYCSIKNEYLDFTYFYKMASKKAYGYIIDETGRPDIPVVTTYWLKAENRHLSSTIPEFIDVYGMDFINAFDQGQGPIGEARPLYDEIETQCCFRTDEMNQDYLAQGVDPSGPIQGEYNITGFTIKDLRAALKGSFWRYIKKNL